METVEIPENIEKHLRANGWVPKVEVLREVRRLLKAGWEYEEVVAYLDNPEDYKGAF